MLILLISETNSLELNRLLSQKQRCMYVVILLLHAKEPKKHAKKSKHHQVKNKKSTLKIYG